MAIVNGVKVIDSTSVRAPSGINMVNSTSQLEGVSNYVIILREGDKRIRLLGTAKPGLNPLKEKIKLEGVVQGCDSDWRNIPNKNYL